MDEHGVGTYAVRNRAGVRLYGSTYPELGIQDALDRVSTTAWQKVLLMGDFPGLDDGTGFAESCLRIEDYTEWELRGKISLADSVNKSMIANEHVTSAPQYNHHVWMHGGQWDGNKLNNATSHIIYWRHQASIPVGVSPGGYAYLKFSDMDLYNADQDALHLESTAGSFIVVCVERITNGGAGRYGLYLYRIRDTHIKNCMPLGGTTRALYMYSSGTNVIEQVYLNGGALIEECERLQVNDWFVDLADDEPAIELKGCRWNIWTNGKHRYIGNDGYSNPAIKLTTQTVNSTDNIFAGLVAGRLGGVENNQFTYVVEEADANQDYNVYSNINGRDCTAGAIRQLGVNGKPRVNPADSIVGAVILV